MDIFALSDLSAPWCVRVVATLHIAERMDEGLTGIDALAAAAKCDADALGRVLACLVARGIFEQPEPGQFALNHAARGLLDPAVHLGLDLDGFGGRMAGAWSTLLSFVRSGKPAYHEAFGRRFWEDLEVNPDVAAEFDALIGPGGHGSFQGEFEITGGWDAVRTVVDVGGGTGAMLEALLSLHSHLHGTLVDLPRTVALSGEILAGVADRVNVVGQSFFEPLPAGADLYLLRGVLNNWPDSEAETLLRGCARAAGPAGRVVILKSIAPDDAPKELAIDTLMVGGGKRTVTEFRALAGRCGLEVIAAGQQPHYFVAECRTDS